jgi:hypothetical protein
MGGFDAFVLLTPVLMLGVLALLMFVGCDVIFDIDPVQTVPCTTLQGLSATPGDGVVFLSWQGYPPEDSPRWLLSKSTTPGGPYSESTIAQGVLTSPQPGQAYYARTYADTPVQNGVTYYYTVREASDTIRACFDTNEAWAIPVPSFVTSTTLGTIRQGFTGLVGMVIVVGGNPLTIYALGRIVAPSNSETHEVKIVDAATNIDVPGSNVLVPTAGGSPGAFAYADLATPVTLNANATYYIVSREADGPGHDQWYNDDTTVVTATVGSVTGSVYGDGASTPPYTINTASDANGNYAYVPLDFQYYGFDRGTG